MSLWLACRSLGVALMPVDAGTPAAEIAALARRFGATIAIAAGSDARTRGARHARRRLTARSSLVRLTGTTPAPQIYRGAAALKVTSGSTGLPKAAFTREAHLVEDTAQITTAMDIRPQDCQIAAIPISHAYGLGNLVMPLLLQGTPMVLREAFIPQQLHADATEYGARVFPGVPFMFAHFATTRTPSPGRACSRRSSAPARRSTRSWRMRLLERSASRFTPSTARPRPEASPSTTRRTSTRPPPSGGRYPASRSRFAPTKARRSMAGSVHVAGGGGLLRLRRADADR